MILTFEIPATSPYVAGHFPGRPILPGVAQLALALEAVRPSEVRGIAHARFRRLVTPPVSLGLEAREAAPGRVRVAVTADGVATSSLDLLLGRPEPAAAWGVAVASRRPGAPPSIESLVPHRGPMLFLDGIVGEAEDGVTCSARIPHECALVSGGFAPALAALEAAAQAAGAWEALRSARAGGGKARAGYLVSARDVEMHATRIPAAAPLVATARLVASAGALTHYRVEVLGEGEPLLRGTIGAYLEAGDPGGQSVRKQNH